MKPNRILKIFVVLSAVLFISGAALAQPKGKPSKIPDSAEIENMVDKLAKHLSLTSDQKNEVLNLYKNHFEEVIEKREDIKELNENAKTEMSKHRQAFEGKVKNLLSDDQQEKFKEFLRNHESQRKNRGNKRYRK